MTTVVQPDCRSGSVPVPTRLRQVRPACLLTNDVETHSIWHNGLRDETGRKVLEEGMPALLDLYERHGVRSTFYFTGYIARKFPEVVRMVLPGGHEVGCHGLSHEVHHGFDVMPAEDQLDHLREAKSILEDIAGVEVVSFRAPALRVNAHTPWALREAGFKIDSSVASQRFDLFLSFGGRQKLRWLRAPRMPYRTRMDDLTRRGDGALVEVPLSALAYPYVGTTMRIAPAVTRCVRLMLHLEAQRTSKPIVFDIHPNELLEEGEGPRSIERRTKSALGYLLQDLVRARLKVRNLGRAAVPLYEREIQFFAQRGYDFLTVRDYCRRAGFDV